MRASPSATNTTTQRRRVSHAQSLSIITWLPRKHTLPLLLHAGHIAMLRGWWPDERRVWTGRVCSREDIKCLQHCLFWECPRGDAEAAPSARMAPAFEAAHHTLTQLSLAAASPSGGLPRSPRPGLSFSSMSSHFARYESFLVKNVSTISSLESTLRSITWILPGRFRDAELASEALSASLNVMSMYHDTLLEKVVQADPKYKALIPPSLHTRYTRAWSEKDSLYKWAARVLQLVRFTELLIEMGLRRKVSQRNRWRGIVLLEVIKAVSRLVLLRITRRPVLTPPIPEREFDPSAIPLDAEAVSPTLAPSSPPSSLPVTPEHLKNNHEPLPLHPLLTPPPPTQSPQQVEDFLLPKALNTSSVKPPTALIATLASPKDWLSEIIYILRPLVYATMLSRKRRNTNPLMVILMMELLARNMRRVPQRSAQLERAEYALRDRDMLWYILRGSIWESWTKPKLEAFANKTANAPLLGLFSALMRDWVPLIDEYHYYTAP